MRQRTVRPVISPSPIDRIERFEAARPRRLETQGSPVCHPRDIVASEAAASRVKDRELLPRLRPFSEYGQEERGKTAWCS